MITGGRGLKSYDPLSYIIDKCHVICPHTQAQEDEAQLDKNGNILGISVLPILAHGYSYSY